MTATATDGSGATTTAGDTATVRISDVAPVVGLVHTVDPPSRPEDGGQFTHTVTVVNQSAEPVRIVSLVDSVYGDLTTRPGSTCATAANTVIAPGASYSCTFTATVTGPGNTAITDVVAVTVVDDDGTSATASDEATVRLTDVPPRVGIDVTSSPATMPEPGGPSTTRLGSATSATPRPSPSPSSAATCSGTSTVGARAVPVSCCRRLRPPARSTRAPSRSP